MPNPTLQRDSTDQDWVQYLQNLLTSALASEASAGEVQLSAVDGFFGPITEESVRFFQRREGLTDDGVVGDATWEALEGASGGGSSGGGSSGGATPGTTTPGSPIDLRIPFRLQLNWPDTTLERVLQDFDQFDLATSPNARLTLDGGANRLAANGAVQLFNREIPLWRNWFLTETTKFTLDWSRDHGFELGLDNEAEFGVRPLRNLDLFIQGDLDVKWRPEEGSGSVEYGGSLNLRWHFDLPAR
jgi:hypothetical protein